jgi:hypothetical protein
MGWYRIPVDPSDPLEMVVNPQGLAERSKVGAALRCVERAVLCCAVGRWAAVLSGCVAAVLATLMSL